MEALNTLGAAYPQLLQGRQASARPLAAAQRTDARAHGHDRDGDSAETRIKYKRFEGTSLYVQTQEGDTVRLRIRSRESMHIHSSQSSRDDAVVAETRVRSNSSTRLALTVKGDLNADELAALRAVFEQASALADEFFAGDLPAVFAQASALDFDSDQIAHATLRLRTSERLTYTAVAQRPVFEGDSAPAPASTAARAPAPASNEPAVAQAQTAAPVTPVAVTPEATAAEETSGDIVPAAAAPATEPADTAGAVSAQLDGLQVFRTILGFLTELLDTLEETAPAEPGSAADGVYSATSIDLSLKLRLFSSIVVTINEVQGPEAGVSDFVPEVIDRMATETDGVNALA